MFLNVVYVFLSTSKKIEHWLRVMGFTWHLIPALLQAQVSGSQKTLQSQPQSSLDIRIARSSCFSSTSIFFTPEDRSSARRFLVVRGCRKKYSSTSVLSRSMSSSDMSSAVSVLASSDSTVPFLVSWKQEGITSKSLLYDSRETMRPVITNLHQIGLHNAYKILCTVRLITTILFRLILQSSYLEFDWVEFLLLQVVSEHVSVDPLLFQGKFSQGVLPDPAVPVRHAQRAATLARHAGEALPPAEVVHCHILEMHPPCPQPLLPLQYWVSCKGRWQSTPCHLGCKLFLTIELISYGKN